MLVMYIYIFYNINYTNMKSQTQKHKRLNIYYKANNYNEAARYI